MGVMVDWDEDSSSDGVVVVWIKVMFFASHEINRLNLDVVIGL